MTKKRMRCLVTIWVLCFIAAVAAACADQNKADFVAAFPIVLMKKSMPGQLSMWKITLCW